MEYANALAARRGLAGRARFLVADGAAPPFGDGAFGAVVSLESAAYMPDKRWGGPGAATHWRRAGAACLCRSACWLLRALAGVLGHHNRSAVPPRHGAHRASASTRRALGPLAPAAA